MDSLETSRAQVRTRLAGLRQAMARHGLFAWVVPTSDPHLSEYLPARWMGRQWLSGFTGSMGTLVVTADFAGVWADSRYWIQADAQLAGTSITLMKTTSGASTSHVDWLAVQSTLGARVGINGSAVSLAAARALRDALTPHGANLVTDLDLLDEIWTDRPGLPSPPVYEHPPAFAPSSRATKLAGVRDAMRSHNASWHFLSTLDDIAWTFNLRGSDVNFNPVFVAHALIGLDGATLFVDPHKIAGELRQALARDQVALAPYENAAAALAALPAQVTLLVDPRRVTLGLIESVAASVEIAETTNPSTLAKSRKSAPEIDHVRAAMESDGAALAEFFAWFEAALGRERITELTIDERICAARARQPNFVSPSFSTIAGFNANGAMPHYHATPASHAVIEGNGLLLIDSGAQYLGGTTDITRVVPVGTLLPEQRRDFTLVLKGMIALARARFPRGTRSPLLDALARAPIWAAGVDYGHGTGHGVGYFLNVHEGPQSISPHAVPDANSAMEAGMITSDEPGIYRPGRWGVRIENLLLTISGPVTEFGEFLSFETLTLCPIDTRCIEQALLDDAERIWLNDYHAVVRARITPHVDGAARAWIMVRTEPI